MEQMEPIKFLATVHSIRVDREGEGKLTLTIPSSDLPNVIKTVTKLEQVLIISVEKQDLPF